MIEPHIGDVYILRTRERDPWGLRPSYLVTIIDHREGWIRYRIGNAVSHDVLPLKTFKRLYEPAQ